MFYFLSVCISKLNFLINKSEIIYYIIVKVLRQKSRYKIKSPFTNIVKIVINLAGFTLEHY